jgi:hypothetical protein
LVLRLSSGSAEHWLALNPTDSYRETFVGVTKHRTCQEFWETGLVILPVQNRMDAATYKIPWWGKSLPIIVFICSALYGCFLWLGYQEAWIHPEQIRAAVYIWTPDTNNVWKLLRKAFDWAALDTADPIHWQSQTPAQRVRPLSDVAQVIDAIARPAITRILYPHPSLTPSSLLAAILAPFFYSSF